MKNWKRLDLSRSECRPQEGVLTALRKMPKTAHPFAYARYDIGYFERDERRPASRKLWWHSGRGDVLDMAQIGKQYNIYWCSVPVFDGPQ